MTGFAGQAVVRMGSVCCLGAGSIKFMGVKAETRGACQVSPFGVFSNVCVLRKESSKMGLHLSRLRGACEFPSLGKWAPASTRSDPCAHEAWPDPKLHADVLCHLPGLLALGAHTIAGTGASPRSHLSPCPRCTRHASVPQKRVHQEPRNVNLLEIESW